MSRLRRLKSRRSSTQNLEEPDDVDAEGGEDEVAESAPSTTEANKQPSPDQCETQQPSGDVELPQAPEQEEAPKHVQVPDSEEKAPDREEKAPDREENAPDREEKAPDREEKAPDREEKAPEEKAPEEKAPDREEKAPADREEKAPDFAAANTLAFVDTLPDNHQGLTAPQNLLALPSYDFGKEDAQDPLAFLRTEPPVEANTSSTALQALPAPPQDLPLNRELFPEEDDDAFGDLDALLEAYPLADPEEQPLDNVHGTLAILEAAVSDDEDAEDWAAAQDRSSKV